MDNITSIVPKRKRVPFTSTEKTILYNTFYSIKEESRNSTHNEICKKIASSMGIHWTSVYSILKEKKEIAAAKSPQKKRPKRRRLSVIDKTDEFSKCGIRNIIHQFFLNNVSPTLDMILESVREDGTLGIWTRSNLYKIVKKIGFQFQKGGHNSLLNDRKDISLWRRNYLQTIRNARQAGQKVYYLDETWISEGHCKHIKGTGKGFIIIHIGSEDGFVEEALHIYESKKTTQEINADVFEDWFTKVVDILDDNCVIVLDNASYHSRKLEKAPSSYSGKQEIIKWLKSNNIPFKEKMHHDHLLQIVKKNKQQYEAFVVDGIAESKNKKVVRLPPYHCELNPIELIWDQVKDYVASEKSMTDLSRLLYLAIETVDAEKWKKCINHVINVVEPNMDQLENRRERFIIDTQDDNDTSESDNDN